MPTTFFNFKELTPNHNRYRSLQNPRKLIQILMDMRSRSHCFRWKIKFYSRELLVRLEKINFKTRHVSKICIIAGGNVEWFQLTLCPFICDGSWLICC